MRNSYLNILRYHLSLFVPLVSSSTCETLYATPIHPTQLTSTKIDTHCIYTLSRLGRGWSFLATHEAEASNLLPVPIKRRICQNGEHNTLKDSMSKCRNHDINFTNVMQWKSLALQSCCEGVPLTSSEHMKAHQCGQATLPEIAQN